jgi:hypothetical protein
MTYAEQLKDPRWQKKRLEVMEREGFKCQTCEAEHKTLHAHHLCYHKGMKPWEYALEDLSCLCEECHCKVEARLKSIRRLSALHWSIDPGRMIDVILYASQPPPDDDQSHEYLGYLCSALSSALASYRRLVRGDEDDPENFIKVADWLLEMANNWERTAYRHYILTKDQRAGLALEKAKVEEDA